MKPKAIICDVDGVLLDTSRIIKEIHERKLKGDEKWDFFHKYANHPDYAIKNEDMFNLINFFLENGFYVFLLTARQEKIHSDTISYLWTGDVKLELFKGKANLIMRPDDNKMQACDLKEMQLKELQKDYDIRLAIDDDLQNCKMFEKNGILTLRAM